MQYKRFSPLGVNIDIDPLQLPDSSWTEAQNMVAQPGGMRRALGHQEIWPTPLQGPQYLLYSPQLANDVWIYCGATRIGTVDRNGTHAEITPVGGLQTVPANGWSGGNLSGLAVLNSFENEPLYWFEGQVNALPLPGQRPTTRYKIMRPFKYHLIGLGVSDGANTYLDQVHWSDASDPGQIPATWVPAPDNEAGDNILADENGPIVDGLQLRDSFYIYKQDSVYEMTYVAGTSIFRFRKVFGTVGCLAKNCVARVDGTHVVLGNGDIYRHDGQNISSIVDGKVKEAFFSTIDNENYESSFVVHLEKQKEVWFCVPTTGEARPNLALTWNTITNEFGYREIPYADFAAAGIIETATPGDVEDWDTDAGEWDQDTTNWLEATFQSTEDGILIADAVGNKLFQADSGVTANGVDYSARVAKYGMFLDDPRMKAIRRIWPRINAPEGTVFNIELHGQRDGSQVGPTLLGSYEYTIGDKFGLACNVDTRWLGIVVESDAQVTWEVPGFDVEYLTRGAH